MEISVTFTHNPVAKDSLTVLKKLNQGLLSVYSQSQRKKYCLKMFPMNNFGTPLFQNERIIAKFNHSNIIEHIPVKCHSSKFHAVVTELAKYGNFLDFTLKGFLNTEVLIRTYFHQLIAGLEYIHSQEHAHLGIKLENLMLGSDFNLKIVNFSNAQSVEDRRFTPAGTEGYRAPEVICGSCEDFVAADIYSAGVILYALLFPTTPIR